jgi:hypothetical protein
MGAEHRTEERVRAALRVSLGDTTGITRDVSASGLYFETDGWFAPGQPITLAVDIDTAGGKIALWCQGLVLRVDERGAQRGVAVRIVGSNLRAQPTPFVAASGA